ncbi:hypothetical protein C4K39_6010 [Pseudomonas sessilinigenes]|nr:hypothetical protein C4K39_6010 [Pseudomonas sessilinigenes]
MLLAMLTGKSHGCSPGRTALETPQAGTAGSGARRIERPPKTGPQVRGTCASKQPRHGTRPGRTSIGVIKKGNRDDQNRSRPECRLSLDGETTAGIKAARYLAGTAPVIETG